MLTKEKFYERLYNAHNGNIIALDDFSGVYKQIRFQCQKNIFGMQTHIMF